MGSSDKNSEYRNIILISQVGICVMIPMFLCMALGICNIFAKNYFWAE